MNFGPTTIERTIANRPAAMTCSMRLDLCRGQGLGDALEPDAAGRLHEHDVARAEQLVEGGDRLLDRGDVTLVVRRRAPRYSRASSPTATSTSALLGGGAADLPVEGGRVRAELGHVAEHGDAAARRRRAR